MSYTASRISRPSRSTPLTRHHKETHFKHTLTNTHSESTAEWPRAVRSSRLMRNRRFSHSIPPLERAVHRMRSRPLETGERKKRTETETHAGIYDP